MRLVTPPHSCWSPIRVVLLLAVLAGGWATPVAAQPPGVNLSWNDCSAAIAGGLNKTSTCQSNTEAVKKIYGSYVLPSDAQALSGNEIVIDIQTNSASLPCWWNFTTAPRNTGYEMHFDDPCSTNGFDYWSTIPGGASGTSTAVLRPTAAVPRIRVTAMVSVDPAMAQPVAASVGEIYSFTFYLKHDATVGGTCAGCLVPACFFLQGIRVYQTGSPTMELFTPSSRNFVFWQGGAVAPPGCLYTPTVNNTWGMVKALYR